MVPTTGLEPVRCYSLEPESSASANSATWALRAFQLIRPDESSCSSIVSLQRRDGASEKPGISRSFSIFESSWVEQIQAAEEAGQEVFSELGRGLLALARKVSGETYSALRCSTCPLAGERRRCGRDRLFFRLEQPRLYVCVGET